MKTKDREYYANRRNQMLDRIVRTISNKYLKGDERVTILKNMHDLEKYYSEKFYEFK